ncbi:4-hydroxythreonine-4-phosphate dehydrogenase PdxA [Porphyrobacter sp. ULC335]|uniref:4-hydroxythreonine-4-phosphate dehydrogenase PdxA n=1 Tax=Porphyrobacter sp. ULC335 TaxID=2854260 RepID=UPI00222077BF|nr:4-hydroxythreonine-4-phosphate dehydrogenase PdxA [Porphyrobacter sp. ULC335]UYV15309.1 4-hydroxythreonine-4-phosphate dehydrogenase PdxA [Porphyrobacter sp. ULC335]
MTPLSAPLAITLGDPAGIGPEVILGAWMRLRAERRAPPAFVVGGPQLLRATAEALKIDCPIVPIADPSEAIFASAVGLPVLAGLDGALTPSRPSPEGASLALASLKWGAKFALSEVAVGLVTAPVAKSALAGIGWDYPGQTEFLADACGRPYRDAVMMLAGPSLRTVPLTVHVALAEVPGLLSADLIMHKARIVAGGLRSDFGILQPRLAIAALNPHAGEGGQFGDEDARIIAPAIAALQAEGIAAFGPVPGDALFTPRARQGYDAALCMYHDQALIPLKALEFDEGVNVTLGLPIIRTSPDHGTAFDIAGKGLADPGAMAAAIVMAAEMAAARAAAHG